MRHLAVCALLLFASTPAFAQPEDLDFKKLIEKGDYKGLGRKLRPYLELDKADPALRRYLELNLEYLARGAKTSMPGEEIILVRGAKNDKTFKMPATSGGDALMLPNSIRYMRTSWDKRLPRIDRYFREATSSMGGNGDNLRELSKIIEHHKGGGLGTSANSTKSVLISASTTPQANFGPPYYILKVAPERAIFNYQGLGGEREVLLPFWVLPKEIVAKVNSYEEVLNHPAYKASKYKDIEFQTYGYGAGGSRNNWVLIEDNIRNGRKPLEGLAGLNSYFRGEGPRVGPTSSERDVSRFADKVGKHGGRIEWVGADDPRLPAGSQARTYMSDGKPKVLLRRGEPVMKFALLDELTHVIQFERMLKTHSAADVETLLLKAHQGDPQARDVVNRWEIRAKRLIRSMLPANDPARRLLTRSIKQLEAELDPLVAMRRPSNRTVDWKKVGRKFGGGLAHFTLAMFLKELVLVAQTGDRMLIEEFFDGLLTTDFYVQYGLFSVGAAGADMAYGYALQKHVARFVRPAFVQSVLRSTVSLAVGMALPDLVAGRFEGRAFAINLAGLGLSSLAVRSGVKALRWVTNLEKVSGGSRVLERLGRMHRLTKVGGFVYQAVETAVVLYFGDMLSREIDERLSKRAARDRVREATAKVLADPKGPGVREALAELAAAHRDWRDLLARPVQEGEALLWERLRKIGEEVKASDDALARYKAMLERSPGRVANLQASVARVEAANEAKFRAKVKRVMSGNDARMESVTREVYGAPAPTSAPSGAEARWILRGAVPGEEGDPYGGRTDWWARRIRRSNDVLDWADDLPETRLASYDHEAALYDALAAAHQDDPGAASEYERLADLTRETRDRDRAMVLGEGPAMRSGDAEDAPADPIVEGFMKTLDGLGSAD